MKKFLAAMLLLCMTGSATIQVVSPEVDKGIASIKQKKIALGAEAR